MSGVQKCFNVYNEHGNPAYYNVSSISYFSGDKKVRLEIQKSVQDNITFNRNIKQAWKWKIP